MRMLSWPWFLTLAVALYLMLNERLSEDTRTIVFVVAIVLLAPGFYRAKRDAARRGLKDSERKDPLRRD